ncbi:MAG: ABC transporter ATP-binding protein [Bacilli bacterium]
MYKIFRKYLHGFHGLFLLLIFTIIISVLIALYIPYLTSQFIDVISVTSSKNAVYEFASVYVSFSIFNLVLGFVISRVKTKILTNISFNYTMDVFETLDSKLILEIEKMNSSYLTQRIIGDCSKLLGFFVETITGLVSNVSIIIFCTIILINTSSLLVMVALALELSLLLWYKLLSKKLYDSKYQVLETNNVLYSKFFEKISLIRFSRIFNAHLIFQKQIKDKFKTYFKNVMKNQVINFLFNSVQTNIEVIGQTLIFVITGLAIINKEMTIGTFLIVSNYFNRLSSSVGFFASVGNGYVDAKVSFDRIKELDEYVDEVFGTKEIADIDKLEIKHLSFSYVNEINVINDFNHCFKKGKIYCIKGFNGAGKTTLFDLLLGFYDARDSIFYNDIPISELDIGKLRENHISYINQKNMFISDSIINNICLSSEISRNNIDLLFEMFNLSSKYRKISLEDHINEGLDNYSGGELQKISLIRGLVRTNDMYLLDEPTSFLDHKSKEILKTILKRIKEKSIVIIISHDEEIFDLCDEIIEL